MKKALSAFLALLLVLMAGGVFAEGVTLRTISIFAGSDAGAKGYADLLAAWEERTGNRIEDSSSPSSEAWKTSILNAFAVGDEPDILFFFAATADSKPLISKVVPIHEINAAYPDLNLTEDPALREEDGLIYAIPVRYFWEGLFCNTALFEAYDLALPTDKESFETAVATFRENGIVPLSISLSDIPHYLVEMAILASGSVEEYRARPQTVEEIPESWIRGMKLIRYLYKLGTFPDNVNATSEPLTTAMFAAKEAAMQLDGSWRANSLSQDSWDNTVVVPFPIYDERANPVAIPGGVSMGFYLTRKAWEDETRRDAAVDLLATLTSEEAKGVLGFLYKDLLYDSSMAMFETAIAEDALLTPIGDEMDFDARSYWFSQIPGIANGSSDPKAVMWEVIRRDAF